MALVEGHMLVEVESAKNLEQSAPARAAIAVKNVLFATDFSATSEAALPYATSICRKFGSKLHLAHVLSDTSVLMLTGGVDYVSLSTIYEDTQNEAKEKLREIAERCDGIAHREYVRHGRVSKNLESLVSQNDIDLIVLGTHGRTGLGKLLLGSVAEDILRHAFCPVLTVGPHVSGRAKLPVFQGPGKELAPVDLEVRQILLATNLNQHSALMAQGAISLAQQFQSKLSLLHVIEDYAGLGTGPEPIEDGLRELRKLIPADAELPYKAETLLEFGEASERILGVASEREADLIVLGARASTEIGGTHLPWSTAHYVIAHAHCPVLTICA